MKNHRIFEIIADISYMAGYNNHYSGDSRFDVRMYISWAKEFEKIQANTNWDQNDYLIAVEKFTNEKIEKSLDTFD